MIIVSASFINKIVANLSLPRNTAAMFVIHACFAKSF